MNASMSAVSNEIISARSVTLEQVKALRRAIFSEEQIANHMFAEGIIDRDEAELLFKINEAVGGEGGDESWRDLFVEAITTHVLKDEISAGELDSEEAEFVIANIEKDGKIDRAELELLVNISATVERTPHFFQKYVRAALQRDIERSGVIDEKQASWIRRVIFGSGSSSGGEIDETEKTWLRQVSQVVEGRKNHATWEMLKHQVGIA